jgi:serine/threonine protein kinase/Tol biopolymer transport system component
MTPERWHQINRLFHETLVCDPAQRNDFLIKACGDDEQLRREVESLISAHTTDGFTETAGDIAAEMFAENNPIGPGHQINNYKVVRQLGSGGMGEVYLADDLRLNRKIALKLLPPQFTYNVEHLRRFEQEARAASALNHPNILTIHEIGEAHGAHFIATEFVDGETLRSLIQRTTMKLTDALDIAAQVASALEAAHQAGVVHRDIKPENVMLRRDRLVKVLDFGLAKLIQQTAPGGPIDSEAPTNVAFKTHAGAVMGTAMYMSPEQAQGTAVDRRTDLWSLGCVLYEMITGHPPFEGATSSHVIVSIIEREPTPLFHYFPEAPAELQRIIKKSLQKDREERYQTAKDLALDLKNLRREIEQDAKFRYLVPPVSSGATVAIETASDNLRHPTTGKELTAERFESTSQQPTRIIRARRGVFLALGAILILAIVAVGVISWRLYRSDYWWSNPLANAQFTQLTDFPGTESDAAISDDGKFVSFLSDHDGPFDVWVGQIATGRFNNLTRGQVSDLRNPDIRPLGFSPDGSFVSFWVRSNDRVLAWSVPTMGGAPRPYLDGPELDWSPDGTRIVYHTNAEGDPLFVTEPNEKLGKQIYAAERGVHCHFPVWSPSGSVIYFVRGYPPDEMDIWRIPSTGGQAERVTFHNSRVTYPTFLNEQTLIYIARSEDGTGPWLYGMDVEKRVPHRISFGVERYTSITVSGDRKRLVATVANPDASLWRVAISDRALDDAAAQRVVLPAARALSPRLGPGYMLYLSSKGGNDGVWKVTDGTAVELWNASLGRVEGAAVSPDGRRIAFTAQKGGKKRLYLMNSDGTGISELATSLNIRGAPAWPPVGDWVTVAADQSQSVGLFNVALDGAPPKLLVVGPAASPVWSPDGRILVYSGVEVGTTFPLKAVTADGKPYQIPELVLSRGSNRFLFLPGRNILIVLKGEFWHKNFWSVDLANGQQRQLTNFTREFLLSDFDVTPEGKEIIFSRFKENSNVILIDLPKPR